MAKGSFRDKCWTYALDLRAGSTRMKKAHYGVSGASQCFPEQLWYNAFMALYESGENYLETILVLKERNGKVRSVDVAAELAFSKPSVSRAIGILKKEGLVTVDKSGWIELTDSGTRRAAAVYDRHNIIAGFLNGVLGVDMGTAQEDACRIEHIISEESFLKMKDKLAADKGKAQ